MPILHIQIQLQAQTPSGQTIALPPSPGLQAVGPVVQVTVGPVQAIIDQWTQTGVPIPAFISGNALFDTGAAVTCIDDATALQLGLPVVDVASMISASDVSQRNVYPIQVIVAGTLTLNVERAMGAELARQGLLVLIGRDVLQHCTLFYNGTAGEFTLSL